MSNSPTVKSTVKQLIECADLGSVIDNTTLEMGGDDGSLPLSNAFNERGTVRTIRSTGTGATAKYNGLQAGLHRCRVSDWLLLDEFQTGGEADAVAAVPKLALFFDGVKKRLSFKDSNGAVHALC